jgi:hypothetical protein
MTALKNLGTNVIVQTTEDYVEEVAGHFEEAIKLQRFLSLPYIEDLGLSKNVFFNAYIRFKSEGILDPDMEFDEFIEDLLGEPITSYKSTSFIDDVFDRLVDLFEAGQIEIIHHPLYEDFKEIKREYEISLAYAGKERSYMAREHDLRTILYLSTPENHSITETGQLNEPFLLTWDSAFYNFRKTLIRKYKNLSYWYIYSPLKFIDRLSLLNFKISPKSVTSNVIALAETNFNYSNKTNSFFDVISTLFNKEDVSDLSIIKRLATLRKETLDQEEGEDSSEDIFDIRETPLTNILLDIRNYYGSAQSKYTIDDLIRAFEEEENSDAIMEILFQEIENYKKSREQTDLFSEFDKIIEKTTANK